MRIDDPRRGVYRSLGAAIVLPLMACGRVHFVPRDALAGPASEASVDARAIAEADSARDAATNERALVEVMNVDAPVFEEPARDDAMRDGEALDERADLGALDDMGTHDAPSEARFDAGPDASPSDGDGADGGLLDAR